MREHIALIPLDFREPLRADRDYLAWAVRWTEAQRGLSAAHSEELTAFRSEAEELLGVKEKTE